MNLAAMWSTFRLHFKMLWIEPNEILTMPTVSWIVSLLFLRNNSFSHPIFLYSSHIDECPKTSELSTGFTMLLI
jgi:hypothetical protein